MTTYTYPNLPVPAGATADDWCQLTANSGDICRSLEWSRHDTADVGVSVTGMQYGDGTFDRYISLHDAAHAELTVQQARALAASLLEAADALEKLQ